MMRRSFPPNGFPRSSADLEGVVWSPSGLVLRDPEIWGLRPSGSAAGSGRSNGNSNSNSNSNGNSIVIVIVQSSNSNSKSKSKSTPSPPTKSLGFKGFDPSKLLILKGGNSHVRIIS